MAQEPLPPHRLVRLLLQRGIYLLCIRPLSKFTGLEQHGPHPDSRRAEEQKK